MVSHELRIPLTSIQGYAELLLEHEQITGEERESLTIVKKNADRLLGLINDLLDLSRMEAGKIDLQRTNLDLARLIREVAGSLRPMIEAKRQRLSGPIKTAWRRSSRTSSPTPTSTRCWRAVSRWQLGETTDSFA
jgi:signal transduction histidine kinase